MWATERESKCVEERGTELMILKEQIQMAEYMTVYYLKGLVAIVKILFYIVILVKGIFHKVTYACIMSSATK